MKFLIIEDDTTKSKLVEDLINNLDYSLVETEKRFSWQGGLLEIMDNGEEYAFLILDMSMPRYDPEIADTNTEFEIFAGWEILKEMKRMNIVIPTCLFTSYDYFGEGNETVNRETINNKLEQEFPQIYKGMVYFRTTDLSWKDKMRKMIEEVLS